MKHATFDLSSPSEFGPTAKIAETYLPALGLSLVDAKLEETVSALLAPGRRRAFFILPTLGKLIANDEDSYRYLAESIRMHPDQETLKGMMEDAGFERCRFHNLTGGIVALHVGYQI